MKTDNKVVNNPTYDDPYKAFEGFETFGGYAGIDCCSNESVAEENKDGEGKSKTSDISDEMIEDNEKALYKDETLDESDVRVSEKGERIVDIPLDEIKPNPDNPYKVDVGSPDYKSLLESIKQVGGIYSPIIVNRKANGYLILAGERRYRAYLELGKKSIPASIVEVSENDAKRIILDSNLHRVNPTEYEAFHIICMELELTSLEDKYAKKVFAKKYSVGERQVRRYIRIIRSLPCEFQNMIGTKITLTGAYTITQLDLNEIQLNKLSGYLKNSRNMCNDTVIREYVSSNIKKLPEVFHPYESPRKFRLSFSASEIVDICGDINVTSKELRKVILDLARKNRDDT